MAITLSQIEQAVKHWASFIKAHEKLIVIGLSALLLFHFGEKGLAAWDAHDKRMASIAQQKVNADIDATKKADAQVEALKQQLAQVTALAEAAKAEAHAATQKHIIADKTMPLPDLEKRWSVLTQEPTTEFSVTPDNKAVVSSEAAHKTVETLETIPDLNVSLTETNKELAACNATSKQQDVDIVAWKTQFTDEHNARTADMKEAKVAEKKAYWKGFKHGVIVTVAAVIGIKIATL